jgi:hypothetical protein
MADDTTSQGRFIGGLGIVLLVLALAFAATVLIAANYFTPPA